MRTYPTNDITLSSLLRGGNPKMISKYVWPLIRSIFALNKSLVSWLLYLILLNELSLTFLFDLRFNLKTRRREMQETTVCFWLTGPTSGSQWATQSLFGATSSRRVVYVTRWGYASWWETFAGGVGLMPRASGMTCQISWTLWFQCWSLGSGVRRIGAIKAPPQPMWNAPVLCGCQSKYRSNTAAVSEPAGDCEQVLQKVDHSVDHVPSRLVGAPNSFWCYCRSHPAFFCGQSFVSSSILNFNIKIWLRCLCVIVLLSYLLLLLWEVVWTVWCALYPADHSSNLDKKQGKSLLDLSYG